MAGRFIDKLKKAARLDPVKREIKLESDEVVVMWVTPLTAAERERAKKDARSDDPKPSHSSSWYAKPKTRKAYPSSTKAR